MKRSWQKTWHRRFAGPVLALSIAMGGAACGGHPPPPPAPAAKAAPAPVVQKPPLCTLKTKLGLERPPRDRSYPTGYWLALLVLGYQESGDFTRPPRDCQDRIARIDRDGCLFDPQPELLPGRLMTPKDLVVTTLDDKRRLVWAMTDRLSDGEAEGPVALAEFGAHGIDVRALGVLRAYPQNVSLRLEKLGSSLVLVADGEHCDAGQTGEECARAVRLVPLVADRFAPKPLVDADGTCLGRAFIPVRSSGIAADSRRMKYRIETLVTFTADTVLLREHLAADGQPPRSEQAGDSYVTRVQADRQVSLRGDSLVASGPSLLSRWLSRQQAERTAVHGRR